MHYSASLLGPQFFQVVNERSEIIGNLGYASASTANALITTGEEDVINVAARAHWDTSAGVTKNGKPYAEISYNKDRTMTLSMGNGRSYFFTSRRKWETGYVLLNEMQQEIACVKPRIKWKTLSVSYEVDVRAKVLDKETRSSLPFFMVYCSKYAQSKSYQRFLRKDNLATGVFLLGTYIGWLLL